MDGLRLPALVLGAVAAAGLAALGTPLDPLAPAAAAADHHVHIDGFAMDPDPLEIEPGESVEWHNHDGARHTATEGDPDEEGTPDWDTGFLSPDESATISFPDETTYRYFCRVHPGSMRGFELVVGDPPTVEIGEPAEGADVSGTVDVSGSASAPSSTLERVEVKVDNGAWRTADGTSSWSITLDTRELRDGEHTFHARSFDGAVYSQVDTVNVSVENPHPDLAVSDLRVENRTAGRSAEVAASVSNGGDGPAPETTLRVTYDVRGDTRLVGTARVPGLEPGASAEVSTTWDTRGQVGRFRVQAVADPANGLFEPDEGNNDAATEACFPDADAACRAPPVDPLGAGPDEAR